MAWKKFMIEITDSEDSRTFQRAAVVTHNKKNGKKMEFELE